MIGKSFEKQRAHTILGLVLALAFAAQADTVTTNTYYQSEKQENTPNAWDSADRCTIWKKDNTEAATTPTAGGTGYFNEYITDLNTSNDRTQYLRSPKSGLFPGDKLTIGTDDKTGTLLLKNGVYTLDDASYVSFWNLELKNGYIAAGGDNANHGISVSNDFVISSTATRKGYLTGAQGRAIILNASLSSADSDAVLHVIRHNIQTTEKEQKKQMLVRLDKASPNYKGKWVVDNKADNGSSYALDTDSKTILQIKVASDNALGDFPAEPMTDAVTLKNGAELAFPDQTTSLAAPFNPTNRWLATDSTTNYLRNSSTSGHLYFAMPITGTGTLKSDNNGKATFLMAKATGSVTFDGGTDTIRIGPGFDWQSSGKVLIDSGALEIASNTVFWTGTGSSSSAKTWEDKDSWDSGAKADTDHEYVIWAMTNDGVGTGTTRYMRTPDVEGPLDFPCKRLTVESVGSSTANLYSKTKYLTINDLRLGRESYFVFASCNSKQPGEQKLSGKITVATPNGSKAYLKGTRHDTQSRFATIEADLIGGTNAYVRLMSYEDYDSDYHFKGDNSKYLGTIDACWYNAKNAAHVNFYGVKTIGGNPTTKLEKGLVVDHSEIVFNETVDVEQPNRGFYANNANNYVNVTNAGTTVTWAGPLNFSSSTTDLTKTGPGIFVLKGSAESPGKLKVKSGSFVVPANTENITMGTSTTNVVFTDGRTMYLATKDIDRAAELAPSGAVIATDNGSVVVPVDNAEGVTNAVNKILTSSENPTGLYLIRSGTTITTNTCVAVTNKATEVTVGVMHGCTVATFLDTNQLSANDQLKVYDSGTGHYLTYSLSSKGGAWSGINTLNKDGTVVSADTPSTSKTLEAGDAAILTKAAASKAVQIFTGVIAATTVSATTGTTLKCLPSLTTKKVKTVTASGAVELYNNAGAQYVYSNKQKKWYKPVKDGDNMTYEALTDEDNAVIEAGTGVFLRNYNETAVNVK